MSGAFLSRIRLAFLRVLNHYRLSSTSPSLPLCRCSAIRPTCFSSTRAAIPYLHILFSSRTRTSHLLLLISYYRADRRKIAPLLAVHGTYHPFYNALACGRVGLRTMRSSVRFPYPFLLVLPCFDAHPLASSSHHTIGSSFTSLLRLSHFLFSPIF